MNINFIFLELQENNLYFFLILYVRHINSFVGLCVIML